MRARPLAVTFAFWFFASSSSDDNDDRRRRREPSAAPAFVHVGIAETHADFAIVMGVRSGNAAIFEALFREYFPVLRRAAYAVVGNTMSAEEVVQDVFIWLWDHRTEWMPHTGVRPYLYGAVRRRALSVVRLDRNEARRRAHAAAYGDEESPPLMGAPFPSPERSFDVEDTEASVWHAINNLPDPRGAILALRWRERMSWEAIAESLGSTVVAVKRQHARALASLRERIFPRF